MLDTARLYVQYNKTIYDISVYRILFTLSQILKIQVSFVWTIKGGERKGLCVSFKEKSHKIDTV
jgi:hypothetical protein